MYLFLLHLLLLLHKLFLQKIVLHNLTLIGQDIDVHVELDLFLPMVFVLFLNLPMLYSDQLNSSTKYLNFIVKDLLKLAKKLMKYLMVNSVIVLLDSIENLMETVIVMIIDQHQHQLQDQMIIVDQIASETHLVDVYVQMDLYFLMADVFQVMEVTVLLIVFPMEDNVYVLMDISNMMESHVLFVQLVKSSFVDNVWLLVELIKLSIQIPKDANVKLTMLFLMVFVLFVLKANSFLMDIVLLVLSIVDMILKRKHVSVKLVSHLIMVFVKINVQVLTKYFLLNSIDVYALMDLH